MSLLHVMWLIGFSVIWAILTIRLTDGVREAKTGIKLRRRERAAVGLAFLQLLLVVPLLELWGHFEPEVPISTRAGVLYVTAIALGQDLLLFALAAQPQWLRRPVRWASVLLTLLILAYAVGFMDDVDFLTPWGAGVACFVALIAALMDEFSGTRPSSDETASDTSPRVPQRNGC